MSETTSASVLASKRVLVPVTAQRRELAERLAGLGMSVDQVEFIAIAPAHDQQALEKATAAWLAGEYEWMAVTSRNAVTAMAGVAHQRGASLADPQPASKIATVGEATLSVCAALGLAVDLVPSTSHNASGIVKEFPDGPGRVLAPLGNLASPVLERGLTRKGWTVDAVEAYRTVDGAGPTRQLVEDVAAGRVDAVLLTSGSVAERLARECGPLGSETMVVAIGVTTAASAKAAGLEVHAVALRPTYDSIVESLLAAFGAQPEVKEAP